MAGQNAPESGQNLNNPKSNLGANSSGLGLAAQTHLQATGGGLVKYPGFRAPDVVRDGPAWLRINPVRHR